MSLQVKFFASLRETLGIESTTIDDIPGLTVRGAWDTATHAAEYPVENALHPGQVWRLR